jgi:hypothetical protein
MLFHHLTSNHHGSPEHEVLRQEIFPFSRHRALAGPAVPLKQRARKTPHAQVVKVSDKIANDHRRLKESHSNLLLLRGVVNDLVADDVLDSLVGEFEVFLDRHSVLDLQNHDRERNDQAAGKQNPA